MTIKHQKTNISAEKQYVITNVTDNPNGILTFTLSNLHDGITDTIEIDLSKHKLRLIKVTQTELNRLKNSTDTVDIKNRESHIYLVAKDPTNDEGIYQEFVWVDNDFEIIGSTYIDLEPLEQKINKVTSWSNPTTNTNYPSEKLVKDSLDTKENSINKKISWSNPVTDISYPSEKLVKNTILESINKATELLNEGELDYETVLQNLIDEIEIKLANFPKKTSDLINDNNFISKEDVADYIHLSDYAKTTDLPTEISDLTNDVDFATNTMVDIKLNLKEDKSNKKTSLDDSDISYPSCKAVKSVTDKKVDKVKDMGLSSNDYTTAEKNKLFYIDANANNYVHPSTKQCNASIPDISNTESISNKVTILDTNSSHYPSCTAVNAGLNNKVDKVSGKGLSTNDYTTNEKNKLANIANNANNYSHPTEKQCNAVIPDVSGKEDKSNKVTTLDTNSSHYPSCTAVNTALNNKVDKISGKGLSSNDYTTNEKNKLANIANNANNYSHPTEKQCNAVIPDVSGKEDKSNKVTTLDTNSSHYPSCTAVNAGLNNKVDRTDVHQTKITCSTYNPTIKSQITVTVKLIDFNGNAVTNKDVTLTCDKGGFVLNSNAATIEQSITAKTNSNGEITATYYANAWGLCTLSCNTSKVQVNVDGWITAHNDSNYQVKYNDKYVSVKITISSANLTTTVKQFGVDILKDGDVDLRPPATMYQTDAMDRLMILSMEYYGLRYKSMSGQDQNGAELIGYFFYARKPYLAIT